MVTEVAQLYSEIFAPEFFVLLCGLTLILYEWYTRTAARSRSLVARLTVLALGWTIGLTIYKGGSAVFESVPSWGPDFTGSLGLGVGILVIWQLWRWQNWGRIVPAFSMVLVVVTIPHLIITPIWDISSHVLYTVTPAGYLALIERRFSPYLLIAFGMVFARPLAGAHTWPESIGGLLLGALVVVGFYYVSSPSDRYDVEKESSNSSVKRL